MQLGVRDVSALFDVPEKTIHKWISRREIPAHRVNDEYRFSRDELLEWATERKLDVSRLLSGQSDSDPALPTVAQALEVGGIYYDVPATNKREALEAMVERIRVPDEGDRSVLLQLLLAREKLCSTGVGDGIAIPHARNPIVLDIASPAIALGFLAKPVDFDAIDRKPVGCLFLLLSPTARVHLHLLSRLARVLKEPSFRSALDRVARQEELLEVARGLADATPNAP